MRKVLIIDHQPFSRFILKDALANEHVVLEATSGAEAIAIARAHQPDLVILDMETEEGRGAATCILLKGNPATKYIPLILLSTNEQKDDIINGLHAGAEDYMMKPISTSELLARVDAHLRTRDYYTDLDNKDLLMLLELTEIISVTRNPKRILNIIVEKMVQAIDVTRCSIIGINEDGNSVVKASSDLPENTEIILDLKKYPEIERALTTQRPVVLQDITSNPLMDSVREEIRGLSDNAIFVVPIIKKQNVIGTFFLRTSSALKGGITDRIYKICQVVANISGSALENAILFETMQSTKKLLEDLAVRDSLTTLYNHKYFHTRCDEEFSRAQRHNIALSCIFIDLDDFKNINDRYGHITGDGVIRQVARSIKKDLRNSDIASRYGGEEFAILLPNTANHGAKKFACRLLSRIRGLNIPQLKGDHITASIGVATYFEENFREYNEFLHAADQAMYKAKQTGKNRICQAETVYSD